MRLRSHNGSMRGLLKVLTPGWDPSQAWVVVIHELLARSKCSGNLFPRTPR